MPDLAHQVSIAWQQTSTLELVAMVLALAYLLFAIHQHVACWYAAFASSVLYVIVLSNVHLYMEAALNVFYAAMALYGYWQWSGSAAGGELRAVRWPLRMHGWALGAILAITAGSGFLLHRFTPAASPFIDSMVAWSSVWATFLVARKVYENWYWWLGIDSVALGLYVTRHLYATALLFALYLVLIMVGMREWRRSLSMARSGHAAGRA